MAEMESLAAERSAEESALGDPDGSAVPQHPVASGEMADKERSALAARYLEVRRLTERLTAGLAPEDMVVQSMPDVSPTKWHLAHTSWFFEQFVLLPHLDGYSPLSTTYLYLFNSYYHQAGERHCRERRGYISRPTVAEVLRYRAHVDMAVLDLLDGAAEERFSDIEPLVTLGLHHEQQHQELLLTDIKHVFSVNPLRPVYSGWRDGGRGAGRVSRREQEWVEFAGGVREIGHDGGGFAFDNEGPRHPVYVAPFEIADRLVTNGEYLEFIDDGGYHRPELWLSLGWAAVEAHGWSEPFYWEQIDGDWQVFTLSGVRPLDLDEPVSHLTYFEADAFARWSGARLPTEAEWEVAAAELPIDGNFIGSERYHPAPLAGSAPAEPTTGRARVMNGLATWGIAEPAALTALGLESSGSSTLPDGAGEKGDGIPSAGGGARLSQFYGDVWEWTASPYVAYPGFRPAPGAIGEYNGKFMCNQFVLRGGSCVTPRSHIRPTYRNFFPPDASWQFTGMRLARDLD